jgi:hypothetical protein
MNDDPGNVVAFGGVLRTEVDLKDWLKEQQRTEIRQLRLTLFSEETSEAYAAGVDRIGLHYRRLKVLRDFLFVALLCGERIRMPRARCDELRNKIFLLADKYYQRRRLRYLIRLFLVGRWMAHNWRREEERE